MPGAAARTTGLVLAAGLGDALWHESKAGECGWFLERSSELTLVQKNVRAGKGGPCPQLIEEGPDIAAGGVLYGADRVEFLHQEANALGSAEGDKIAFVCLRLLWVEAVWVCAVSKSGFDASIPRAREG